MNTLIVLILLCVAYLIFAYNRLVKQRNRVSEGWSGVDVQLKRRHDLIPNLVSLVKSYTSHERETLQQVTTLREQSAAEDKVSKKAELERGISGDIVKLLAVVEAYPELKADSQFQKLHSSLIEIEDNLQYARRYYNGTVRDYNTFLESFPIVLFGRKLGFLQADFFRIDNEEERDGTKVIL